MLLVLRYTLSALRAVVRERRELALENIALRHQVEVLARGRPRPVGRQNLMRPTDTHDASLLAPAC